MVAAAKGHGEDAIGKLSSLMQWERPCPLEHSSIAAMPDQPVRLAAATPAAISEARAAHARAEDRDEQEGRGASSAVVGLKRKALTSSSTPATLPTNMGGLTCVHKGLRVGRQGLT